jgi:putative SOS response-associated peptidase YedK
MCSIISVKTSPGLFERTFSTLFDPEGLDSRSLELRVHGFLKKEQSPVVFRSSQNQNTVGQKFFSLCPHWSKSWPFPYETYNARLTRPKKTRDVATGRWEFSRDKEGRTVQEEITSVPSFRDAFALGQTCLVPLSGAIESCYFGKSAGSIVRFTPTEGILFAAGLWNDWMDPATGEFIPTFTLLTDDPDPVVFENGHDRGLLILQPAAWESWLQPEKIAVKDRVRFLRDNRIQPQWQIVHERQLKEGWQKRAPRREDIDSIAVWQPS